MTAGAFESALPCPQHSLTTLSAFEERNVPTRQNTFLFTKDDPKTEGGVTDMLNRSKNYISDVAGEQTSLRPLTSVHFFDL